MLSANAKLRRTAKAVLVLVGTFAAAAAADALGAVINAAIASTIFGV